MSNNSSDQPLVTVIVLCFAHERYVERSIESALDQAYGPIEIIVTDDASPDGSIEVIERAIADTIRPVTLLTNSRNLGLCATLNRAISHVSGRYLVLISADDWMEPNRVARQVEIFERLPTDYCVVHSDLYLADADGHRLGRFSEQLGQSAGRNSFVDLVTNWTFTTPSAMIRSSALERVGPYDETLPAEDFDMYLRLALEGRFFYIDEPLVTWREVPTSLARSTGTIGQLEYCLPSLVKHLGSSHERDRMLARRMSEMAIEIYAQGGDRALAAKFLRLSACSSPHPSAIVFGLLSSLRCPPRLARALLRVRAGMDRLVLGVSGIVCRKEQ